MFLAGGAPVCLVSRTRLGGILEDALTLLLERPFPFGAVGGGIAGVTEDSGSGLGCGGPSGAGVWCGVGAGVGSGWTVRSDAEISRFVGGGAAAGTASSSVLDIISLLLYCFAA